VEESAKEFIAEIEFLLISLRGKRMCSMEEGTVMSTSIGKLQFSKIPTSHQKNVVWKLIAALGRQENIVLSSCTGTGKTLMALTACITYMNNSNADISSEGDSGDDFEDAASTPHSQRKKLLYIVRTTAQADDVMKALEDLSTFDEYSNLTSLQLCGKKQYCINSTVSAAPSAVIGGECKKCKLANECPYNSIGAGTAAESILHHFGTARDIEDLGVGLPAQVSKTRAKRIGTLKKQCPEQVMEAKLSEGVDVIVGTYNYLFSYATKQKLHDYFQNAVIIADESHNLHEVVASANTVAFDSCLVQDAVEQLGELDLELLETLLEEERSARNERRAEVDAVDDDGDEPAASVESLSHHDLSRATNVLEKLSRWMHHPPSNVMPSASTAKNGLYHPRPSATYPSSFFTQLMKKCGIDCFVNGTPATAAAAPAAVAAENEHPCSFVEEPSCDHYSLDAFTATLEVAVEAMDYLYVHAFRAKHASSVAFVDYSHSSLDELSRLFKILTAAGGEESCSQHFASSYKTVLMRGSSNYDANAPQYERSYDLKVNCSIKLSFYPSANALQGFGQSSFVLMSGSFIHPVKSVAELQEANTDKVFKLITNKAQPLSSQFVARARGEFAFTRTNLMRSADTAETSFMFSDTADSLLEYSRISPGGIIVVFPSFRILSLFVRAWKKTWGDRESHLQRLHAATSLIIETQASESSSSNAHDALSKHKIDCDNKKPSMILAVARGRFSEGADFPGSYCRMLIVIGLPLMPSADPEIILRQQYLNSMNRKSSRLIPSGQDFYLWKSLEPVVQALGRLIRGVDDFGCVVLHDERYSSNHYEQKYRELLPPWIKDELIDGKEQDVIADCSAFFRDRANT
jgi:Rad3-related DNA helicase